MQKLTVLSYDLKNCSLKQKTAIQRSINGYKDHSNNQAYTYSRKGILEDLPHKQINRGVIIIKSQDKHKIIPLLNKNKAQVMVINLYSKKAMLH